MKKLITILLAVSFAFGIVSCDEKRGVSVVSSFENYETEAETNTEKTTDAATETTLITTADPETTEVIEEFTMLEKVEYKCWDVTVDNTSILDIEQYINYLLDDIDFDFVSARLLSNDRDKYKEGNVFLICDLSVKNISENTGTFMYSKAKTANHAKLIYNNKYRYDLYDFNGAITDDLYKLYECECIPLNEATTTFYFIIPYEVANSSKPLQLLLTVEGDTKIINLR